MRFYPGSCHLTYLVKAASKVKPLKQISSPSPAHIFQSSSEWLPFLLFIIPLAFNVVEFSTSTPSTVHTMRAKSFTKMKVATVCHLLVLLPSCIAAMSNYWDVLGCDSAQIPGGHNIETLYQNAVDMANYTSTQLDVALSKSKISPNSDESKAALGCRLQVGRWL